MPNTNTLEAGERTQDALRAAGCRTADGKWMQGTKVRCNGYEGAVIRHYSGNMYEIRVPGGVVCNDDFEVIDERASAKIESR